MAARDSVRLDRRSDALRIVMLYVVVAGVYVWAGAKYSAQSMDVVAAEEPARALAVYGSLDLSAIRHVTLPWYFVHDGGLYSDRFPGAIAFLVPAYWVADKLGVHSFTFVPGAVTAALVAAGSVTVMWRVFVRILSLRAAAVATVVFAFGSGTWSISAHAPWSHTIGQFLVCLTLLALSRKREGWAALAAGLTVTTRPIMAVGVAVLGSTLAAYRRSPKLFATFAMLCLPGVLLLFTYNGLMFQHWGPSNGHELYGDIEPLWKMWPVNIAGTLFSPSRGVLFFYPFLVVVPFTLRSAWRAAQDWERAAVWAGIGALLTQLLLNRYSGGDTFFGNRLIIEPMTFCAPLLARSVALAVTGSVTRLAWFSLGLAVLIHAVGAIALWY